jgi:uridine kinase
VPVYEIAQNGRCGSQRLDLAGSPLFVAEGIFAPEIVPDCRRAGLLEAAYCITQRPAVTFWRRLTRDLREHRKPPLILLRRGLALMRDQRRVVTHAVELGCEVATPDEAFARIRATVRQA